MVTGLAFLATAVASLFAEATFVRWTQRHTAHLGAWTVALAMFAGASAALAVGVSTGWDDATFRVFYLLGAVLNVPWLAFGTVCLLAGAERRGRSEPEETPLAPLAASTDGAGAVVIRRSRAVLVFFSGLAVGVLLIAPMEPVSGTTIPVGSDVFGALPRVLAAVGSSVGAIVILGGAGWSALRYARDRSAPGHARLAGANGLIALGTLVLSSGGLIQGVVGHDEAFTASLALGITVIYVGFLTAEGRRTRPQPAVTT